MSRSPKYTTAWLAVELERRLSDQRRQREQERARRQAAARERRLAEERSRLQGQVGERRARLTRLTREARANGVAEPRIATALRAAEATVRKAADEPSLAAAGQELSRIDQQLDALSARIVEHQVHQRQDAALGALTTLLDTVPDRDRLDPDGADATERLLTAARRAMGDTAAFDAAHRAARVRVEEHLRHARARSAELAEARRRAERAAAALADVLDEVRLAGADLRGVRETKAALEQHARDLDSGRIERAADATPILERAAETLSRNLEEWQSRMERIGQIVQAAASALPRAGLQITPGSYQRDGDTVSFQASRGDGSAVGVVVQPNGDQGARIRYQAPGTDFVIDQQTGTATCDRTEELLEKFHRELARDGVETGELRWEGKPSRPDARTAAVRPEPHARELGAQ